LTLALCAPLALAQGTTGSQSQGQTPPPSQQGQSQGAGPRGMGPGGRRGPGGPGGGHMGGGGDRDGSGRDGMRGGMRGDMNGRRKWGHHGMHGGMHHGMRRGMRNGGGNDFRGGRGMWGGGGGRGMGQGFGGGQGMGRGGQMPLGRIVNDPALRQQLGITPDQVAKFTQQQTDFQKAGIQGRATLEVKHLELRQLMSAPTPDRAAIDAKLQEISTAQLAAEKLNIHHQLDMKSALTADQQAKLKELMQARRQGGPGGQRGPGGRGGPGGPGAGRPQSQPKQPGSGDQPISPDGLPN